MTKTQFYDIMKRNGILFFDVEDTINFVNELLEFQAQEIEETEPYATNTIRRLKDAAYEVFCLKDYLEEAEVI